MAVAACSDDSGPSAGTSTTVPGQQATTTIPPDDGVLRIGVLLPSSGTGAPFGGPLVTAAQMAIDEINADGGVNGTPVQMVPADEGDSIASAAKAVGELVEARVDAVVGPASSKTALAVLGTLVDHRIVTCSPTAAAISLTAFPDDGYFLRTIPSDTLQAVAMAELVEGAGVDTAMVLAPDDAYGRPYADAVRAALVRRGVSVDPPVLYRSSDDARQAAVGAALASNPGAVALIGTGVGGRQMVEALDALAPKGLPVVVNDGLRRAPTVDATPLATTHIDVIGASPRSGPSPSASWFTSAMLARTGGDPAELSVAFGAHAYDCVSLVALAAQAGGDNTSATVAANVRSVSTGGASCGNFVTCKPFLDQGRNIDLNGASGPLELDANGDPGVGLFDRFRFDDAGRDLTVGDLQVTAV
jgi:branched-chain amino acid transport system substrate-binding protein